MKIKGITINLPKDLVLTDLQDKSLKGFFNAYGETFFSKGYTSVDVDTRANWLRRRVSVSGLTAIDNGILFRQSLPDGVSAPDNVFMKNLGTSSADIEKNQAEIKLKSEKQMADIKKRVDVQIQGMKDKFALQVEKMATRRDEIIANATQKRNKAHDDAALKVKTVMENSKKRIEERETKRAEDRAKAIADAEAKKKLSEEAK